MKKVTACLSAILVLGLLSGPLAIAAPAGRDPVVSPTEPGPESNRTPPELPDPNEAESPDTVVITDEDVPLSYSKIWEPEEEEYTYILDEEPPLANRTSPQTGVSGTDSTAALALAAAALCVGGVAALVKGKRYSR